MSHWNHSDVWRRHGRDFFVEVSRRDGNETFERGPSRWAVHVCVYPGHPLFDGFSGNSPSQTAALALPFHRIPSMLEWRFDAAGNRTSIQISADYVYSQDKELSFMRSEQGAVRVFHDADALFDFLHERAVRQADHRKVA